MKKYRNYLILPTILFYILGVVIECSLDFSDWNPQHRMNIAIWWICTTNIVYFVVWIVIEVVNSNVPPEPSALTDTIKEVCNKNISIKIEESRKSYDNLQTMLYNCFRIKVTNEINQRSEFIVVTEESLNEKTLSEWLKNLKSKLCN